MHQALLTAAAAAFVHGKVVCEDDAYVRVSFQVYHPLHAAGNSEHGFWRSLHDLLYKQSVTVT